MSLQDDLALALARIGVAIDKLDNVDAKTTAAIAQVVATYQARLSTLVTTFYISGGGSDAALGTTPATPLRTLAEASRRTPVGGFCRSLLQTAIEITEDVELLNKHMVVGTADSTQRTLLFNRRATNTVPSYRSVAGFFFMGRSSLVLNNLFIAMPELSAEYNNTTPNYAASPFRPQGGDHGVMQSLTFNGCTIAFPNTLFSPLTASINFLYANGCVISGSPNGKWVDGYGASAGTSPANLPLITNLATI